MKKILLLFLILALYFPGFLAAQSELTVGRTATLGIEATTTFGWDINNNSTGLDTKVGMELIFPLFPTANMGSFPDNDFAEDPEVRLILRNASFTWWNTFFTSGGNYEQDHFNKWQAKPLILTFEEFLADLVWKNYFFRVASSTTVMQTNMITLRSIFDDVIDAENRFYYKLGQALWPKERYNIQEFPLLKYRNDYDRINNDLLDIDYRKNISGILAFGAEYNRLSAVIKAASRFPARGATEDFSNVDNAWLFGADLEVVPIDKFKIDITGFSGLNYDKLPEGRNPLNIGFLAKYQFEFNNDVIFTPFLGFDFANDKVRTRNSNQDIITRETQWELGAGLMIYTRGFNTLESSRILDYDTVIPVGASFATNINQDNYMNIMVSWFDPAGRDSIIPYFGGFLQFEVGNLLNADIREGFDSLDYAFLVQAEYSINEKVLPFIRTGYGPQFIYTDVFKGKVPETAILRIAGGCYLTMIQFFTLGVMYEMRNVITTEEIEIDSGLFSIMFTIRR